MLTVQLFLNVPPLNAGWVQLPPPERGRVHRMVSVPGAEAKEPHSDRTVSAGPLSACKSYCTPLFCHVMYCTALHSIVLHCMSLYCISLNHLLCLMDIFVLSLSYPHRAINQESSHASAPFTTTPFSPTLSTLPPSAPAPQGSVPLEPIIHYTPCLLPQSHSHPLQQLPQALTQLWAHLQRAPQGTLLPLFQWPLLDRCCGCRQRLSDSRACRRPRRRQCRVEQPV